MPVTCRLYRRKNGKYYARHNETGASRHCPRPRLDLPPTPHEYEPMEPPLCHLNKWRSGTGRGGAALSISYHPAFLLLAGGGVRLRPNEPGRQISLRTSDENPAKLLLPGHNEGRRAAQVSRAVGLAYLSCTDPAARKRTWAWGFAEVLKTKSQDTDNYRRWRVAIPHISANLAPARPIFPPTFPTIFQSFVSRKRKS